MINQKTRKKITRYMQILFVVLAFGLMVIASYLFVSNIERKHLMDDTMAALNFSELKIESDLMEPETLMGSISQTIRSMILSGYGTDVISRYMADISNNVIRNKNRKLSSTGVYGLFEVFNNKFIDLEWTPPADYVPQERPWYKTAVAAEGKVAVTPPYLDIRTKSITIAYVVRIFDDNNTPLAVLSMNVPIDRISEYIVETRLAEGGYGLLLSEDMEVIAHPYKEGLGMHLRKWNSGLVEVADELEQKEKNISERRLINYRGDDSIVSFRRLENGWYLGIVTPYNKYYQTTRIMALYLTTLGVILAMALIAVLLVLFRQMNRDNEKSRTMAHWYNSILNAIPLPISVTDADANWTFINTMVEKILGITLEDAVGKPCSNWGSVVCNTENCGIVCAKKGVNQTYFSDGNLSYQVDTAILKDLNDKTMGYIEVAHDITNLKLMAKKQADAEAANLAKSTFLAKVSHEVRTPMNAILGITEIQLQDETLPQNTQEALGSIYNSGYLLLGIINDILDLSKIEAGKLELSLVNYDVPSLINDTVHLNIMRYDSKPIEFILQVDENIPTTLFGDDLRIKQILNNLLSNAFKYTNSGKVTLSVTCEARQGEAAGIILVFRVTDTGQGMTAEQLSKLFEEYTRFNTEANRATVGTGLGMAITKYLVKMMNGTISVESEPGKGSAFTVRMPQGTVDGSGVLGRELAENLKQFRLGKAEQMKKAPQIMREYMPYGKVLIVDDVETNLYVAKGLLAPYGLTVETVRSGFEAIEKIKDDAVYDIIFMDHFMPEMDGIVTTKKLRELGYTRPIVALTANALAGQAEMFAENGFDDFISKPIDIRQLNAALNRLVRDKYPAETVEAARRLKVTPGKVSANGNAANGNYANDVSQPSINPELVRFFTEDAEKAVAALETLLRKKEDGYGEEDIKTYIINVHAMKSALANIGEKALSDIALKLEQAGRAGNTAVMIGETTAFMDSLRTVIEKIKPKDVDKGGETMDADDRYYLLEKLTVLQEACAEYNKKAAKAVVVELRQKTWPRPVNELLDAISDRLLHSEFSEAAGIAKDYDVYALRDLE